MTNATENEQLLLQFNRPLAKSIPDRSFSKNEQMFFSWVKNGLQELYYTGQLKEDDSPAKITVDLNEVVERRGLTGSNATMFKQRLIAEIKKMFEKSVPSIWVVDYDEKGVLGRLVMAICDSIFISDNVITAVSGLSFQKYYISRVLSHPELQVHIDFYLQSKCQYSEGILNLLLAYITDMRLKEGEIKKEYRIVLSYEDIYERVPPRKGKYAPGDYKIKVIDKSINDINGNPASPLSILSTEYVRGAHNTITAYIFNVRFTDASRDFPPFVTYSNAEYIHPNGFPFPEYVFARLKKMGVANSTIAKARKKPYPMVACCFMYTLSKGGSPKLFNTALNNWRAEKSYMDYVYDIKTFHPELMDDVIKSILEKDILAEAEEPRVMPSKTEDTPFMERLRQLSEKARNSKKLQA